MTASSRPQAFWVGLCLPELPLIAVWHRLPEHEPVAVHETHRGRARIRCANACARAAGVRPGQALTEALALAPELASRPRHADGERRVLEHLALIAYGFSHQVVPCPPDTVLLEAAGSRRLYGGLGPLLRELQHALVEAGLPARPGSAPFAAAARLLARLGRHAPASADLHVLLDGLAPEQMDLPGDCARALAGCGLRTTAAVVRIPPAERARRFGPDLNRHLDALYGRRDTPLAGWRPPERFRLKLELPVATDRLEALGFALHRGLGSLRQWLRVRDRALTRLHLALIPEDGGRPVRVQLGLAQPGSDRQRLMELVRLKLESVRLPGPVETITLAAETTVAHRPPQADLFAGGHGGDAWPALLDRLGARLGEDGVRGLAACPDHRPDKAWCWTAPGRTTAPAATPPRPGWLLPNPRPCRVEQLDLEDGPERIESGWWDGGDCRRDYWIARDRHGRRLWVFREYKPRRGWFIHGVFG